MLYIQFPLSMKKVKRHLSQLDKTIPIIDVLIQLMRLKNGEFTINIGLVKNNNLLNPNFIVYNKSYIGNRY